MKKFRKLTALVLSIILVFSLAQTAAFAYNYVNPETEDPDKPNFLLLGDSIAEGFGIMNEDEACYGRIVADTEGYNYRNLARTANDTSDLIDKLTSTQTDIYSESVKWADIINISIGSNNYFANKYVVPITVGALFYADTLVLDRIAEGIYEDFNRIYDIIRELNPDAVLIFNNVHCSWGGLGYIPFSQAVRRINKMLDRFSADHPGEINIFDTYSVLTGHNELIANDSVHPNAAGNVELAKKMLVFLNELGLGDKTEPVVAVEGVDYNFFVLSYGKVFGTIITAIVSVLTLHF